MVSALRRTPFDGEPPLTAEQFAAVTREGHTILEAGAGSGKTTSLVGRMVEHVVHGVHLVLEPAPPACGNGCCCTGRVMRAVVCHRVTSAR